MNKIFTQYYQDNFWGDDESKSGSGSNTATTEYIRQVIPTLLTDLGITSVLDIPCGDFWWMGHINEIQHLRYIGADIVTELIHENQERYPGFDFRVMDVTADPLPKVDLVFCRDLLGHFSNKDVQLAIRNIKKSKSKYLLATTFPSQETSGDIKTGEWRPINLERYFGLPAATLYLPERCKVPGFEDKSLGLWVI